MKFLKNKNYPETTIRKVVSDDKQTKYGICGTAGDLLAANIISSYVCRAKLNLDEWLFIPIDGHHDLFITGDSREKVLAHIPA